MNVCENIGYNIQYEKRSILQFKNEIKYLEKLTNICIFY